jgi:ubiquinone/menaquinone biosynthesis C-methylase UbiE
MSEPYRPDWNSFARANASQQWRHQSAAMGGDATRALVVEAQITEGLTVLDVATGTGEPAISVATAMNGTGRVVASDISEGPLKIARQRAEQRGLTNIEFAQADAQALPFADATFDRITSRLGVMFFPDTLKALREFHRVLKPGGRVSLLTWGPIDQPYFTTTAGTIMRILPGSTVPPSAASMFKFADPKLLHDLYAAAGFTNIDAKIVPIAWTWPGTPEEVWEYFQDVTVPFRPLLDSVPPERREEIGAAVVKEIARLSEDGKVEFDARFVLASATR